MAYRAVEHHRSDDRTKLSLLGGFVLIVLVIVSIGLIYFGAIGWFIASQMARAHGRNLEIVSWTFLGMMAGVVALLMSVVWKVIGIWRG